MSTRLKESLTFVSLMFSEWFDDSDSNLADKLLFCRLHVIFKIRSDGTSLTKMCQIKPAGENLFKYHNLFLKDNDKLTAS